MMHIFSKILSGNGLILFSVFLILFILVGFIIKKRKEKRKPIVAPKIMRYLILPTALIYAICLFILELPRSEVSIKITETILIIFAIYFLLNMMSHLFFSKDNILTGKESIPKLGRDIILFILILISGAFVFSSIWGVNLGHLLTALGVGSFVIGLALQEPLGNLFNGISLLIAQPFEKGDWVSIGNDTGKIVDINWRSVKIVNRHNELIIIPNNAIGKERIKNLSRPSKINAEMVEIGFSYKDDPIKVKEALMNLAKTSDNILKKPEPIAILLSYNDFYINYGLWFFIKDFEHQILLKDEIMTKIYKMTQEHNFTIPFPIQDIYLKNKNDE